MPSVSKEASSTIFKVFGMTRPGIEPRSPGPLANTLTIFINGLGDLGSIPGQVIPKTQKMVLDASLLNTQHYKVQIKGKVEQSKERSSALSYTLVVLLLKRGAFGSPLTMFANFYLQLLWLLQFSLTIYLFSSIIKRNILIS